MSQWGKSAITFPYIILKPSHGNTDPSQPILTHEIWQAVPEVIHLLLGNRIMITGRVHLGFGGRPGSQAAGSLIQAGFTFKSHFHVWSSSHSVFVEWTRLSWVFHCLAFGDFHCPMWESWTVRFLEIMDCQFSRHAEGSCFLSPAKWCDPWSFPWAAIKISEFFFSSLQLR